MIVITSLYLVELAISIDNVFVTTLHNHDSVLCTSLASPCRDPEQRGGQPPAWLPQDGQPCPPLTTSITLGQAGTVAEKSRENWDVLWSLDA